MIKDTNKKGIVIDIRMLAACIAIANRKGFFGDPRTAPQVPSQHFSIKKSLVIQ